MNFRRKATRLTIIIIKILDILQRIDLFIIMTRENAKFILSLVIAYNILYLVQGSKINFFILTTENSDDATKAARIGKNCNIISPFGWGAHDNVKTSKDAASPSICYVELQLNMVSQP